MDKKTSIYLNLLRVIATFLVFIGHFSYEQFSGKYLNKIGIFPHDAVIIFFVLSGYVIVFVAYKKDNNIKEYFCSRFARIYSVLLPAMILTIILDNIGMVFNANNYSNYNYSFLSYCKNIIANGLCIQEIANRSIRFFSNGPLWSLGYEVIYYVFFGLMFYMRKSNKIKITVLISMILFYKVTLLFPIWLLGVLAYKLNEKININKAVAYILFILSPILFLILKKIGLLTLVDIPSLGYSRYLVGDYITSILIFINILSIRHMKVNILNKIDKPVKKLADFSFSIYLYHFPILMFMLSVFKYKMTFINVSIVGITTILICYALSLVTEKKKHLYKSYIKRLINKEAREELAA